MYDGWVGGSCRPLDHHAYRSRGTGYAKKNSGGVIRAIHPAVYSFAKPLNFRLTVYTNVYWSICHSMAFLFLSAIPNWDYVYGIAVLHARIRYYCRIT